jgi:hypothetical protein
MTMQTLTGGGQDYAQPAPPMDDETRQETEEPVVDVGIPTKPRHGGEPPRYLAAAVESVLAQTFPRWRLTISENALAADDAVASLLRPFVGDPRIRHVVTGQDWSGARNSTYLLEAGRARYVALLHDDDVWDPDWLERRVTFLDAHPECAYVFAGNRLIDERGDEFGRSDPAYAEGVHEPREVVPLLLERKGMPMPPTALVRRSAYDAVGPVFDERFPAWDYDMVIRLAARFPVGYLDVWDSGFRIHTTQQTYGERWGERKILLEDVLDEILVTSAPELRLPEAARRRRRADAHMSAALDAVETGRRRDAVRLVAGALRLRPAAVANPRLPAVLLSLPLGTRSRPLLTRVRRVVRRRGYLHGRKPGGAKR